MTEERVIQEYTQHFQTTFAFTPKQSQFCFIDNGVLAFKDSEEHEKKMFLQSIVQIKNFTKSQEPFFCKDIKEVLKEKDALLKRLKKAE
jgi:hypothetical protein